MSFFEAKGDPARAEDETFDAWLAQMQGLYRGLSIRRSERLSDGEVRILAVEYDFDRAIGKWMSYLTLRMKGHTMWYFDASGLASDMDRFRDDLITTLALLTVG